MADPGHQAPTRRAAIMRAVVRASDRIVTVERVAAIVLIAAVAGLILLNVFTRYLDYSLYWVDEAATYAMVWATLVATSSCVRQRRLIAVTILEDMVPPGARRIAAIAIDVIVFGFGLALIWFCWLWFAPLELWRADFSVSNFVMNTGNFIYREPTLTIGIAKIWVWLIMPVFSVTFSIHSLANLAEQLAGGRTLPQPSDTSAAG